MSFRQPRIPVVGRHFNVGGVLAPGTVLGASASASVVIPVHGALKSSFRGLLAAGTANLTFEYLAPSTGADPENFEAADVHATGNPAVLALTTAEAQRNVDDHRGEAYLKLTVTAGGGGCTIDYIAVSIL